MINQKVIFLVLVAAFIHYGPSATISTQDIAFYRDLGCWKDVSNLSAISDAETDPSLDGDYTTREFAVVKCAKVASSRQLPVFAMQDGGKCLTSCSAEYRYRMFGKSSNCGANGLGGPSDNHVYELDKIVTVVLEDLGCWKDSVPRTMPALDGTDPLLSDFYLFRKSPKEKCAQVAYTRGFDVFGIQHSGNCRSSATANSTYRLIGISDICPANGEGAGYVNNMYRIRTLNETKLSMC